MSSFVALNVDQEDFQDAEEHTRELQVEEALKVFQKALWLQRDGHREEARNEYVKLFNIEVLNLTHQTGLPPAAERIKYLAHRNYGQLLLGELEQDSKSDKIDRREELVSRVEMVLDQFEEALCYDNGAEDVQFLEMVCALAVVLKYYRAARLTLEMLVFSDDVSSRACNIGELLLNDEPITEDEVDIVQRLRGLLDQLGDSEGIASLKDIFERASTNNNLISIGSTPSVPDLSWITSKFDIADPGPLYIGPPNFGHVDITIATMDWISISNALNDIFSTIVKSKRKILYEDPYSFSSTPALVVRFQPPKLDSPEILDIKMEGVEEVEEVEASEQEDEVSPIDSNNVKREESVDVDLVDDANLDDVKRQSDETEAQQSSEDDPADFLDPEDESAGESALENSGPIESNELNEAGSSDKPVGISNEDEATDPAAGVSGVNPSDDAESKAELSDSEVSTPQFSTPSMEPAGVASPPIGVPSLPTEASQTIRKRKTSEPSEVKHRSSKRVKARPDEQSVADMEFSIHLTFFNHLNGFLSQADSTFESMVPAFVNDNEQFDPHDQYLYDFRMTLESWSDDQAESFLKSNDNLTATSKSKGKGEKSKLKSPAKASPSQHSLMQMLNLAALGTPAITRPPFKAETSEVEEFVSKINAGNFHLQETRLEFIKVMLLHNASETLLETIWPSSLWDSLTRTIESCEPLLFHEMKTLVMSDSPDLTTAEDLVLIAEALLEIALDSYLATDRLLKIPEASGRGSGPSKSLAKELETTSEANLVRIGRWQGIFGDLVSVLGDRTPNRVRIRNLWVSAFAGAAKESSPEYNLHLFEGFQRYLCEVDPKFEIEFVNFTSIPRLSLESCQTQVSKFRAASVFARIFMSEQTSEPEDVSNDATKEPESSLDVAGKEVLQIEATDSSSTAAPTSPKPSIALLESILMPDKHEATRVPEHEAIMQFLSTASLQFRIQLWCLLLDSYDSNGESQKSFDGYLRILISCINEFTKDTYEQSSEKQRSVLIVQSLSICLDIGKSLVRLISNDESLVGKLSREQAHQSLQDVIKLLRLLYIYPMMQDAIKEGVVTAPSHNSWSKSCQKLDELSVYFWCLLYYFFRASLPEGIRDGHPDVLNDVLSIIHEALGSRNTCALADGVFLDLCLSEMVRLDWDQSENDMLQCMRCRYGLVLANDYFVPYDHASKSVTVDRRMALSLTKYVMRMVYRKKNLVQYATRNETKTVLDQFFEAIGHPDAKKSREVQHNLTAVEEYFSLPVSFSLIRDSFIGRNGLAFEMTPGTIQAGSDTEAMRQMGHIGLFYVLGLVPLSQFRSKKRTSPLKTIDVEESIHLFKSDLACGTDRFETWVGLAQAYDLLVEEDLTWTAEKLQGGREQLVRNQRMSMLAGLMAVRVYLRDMSRVHRSPVGFLGFHDCKDEPGNSHYDQVASGIWIFLGKAIYGATRPPLKMEAFADNIPMRVYSGPEDIYYRPAFNPPPEKAILHVVKRCCELAAKDSPKDWMPHFLASKVLHKLACYEDAIKEVLASIEILSDKHSHESIIEPHYKLVSFVYKYAFFDHLPVSVCWNYLRTSPYYVSVADEPAVEEQLTAGPSLAKQSLTETVTVHDFSASLRTPSVVDVEVGPVVLKDAAEDATNRLGYAPLRVADNVPSSAGTQSSDTPKTEAEVQLFRTLNFHDDKKPRKAILPQDRQFYRECIETLKKIRAGDKKKWQHRPTYRIAKVYEEVFNDIKSAKEEMMALSTIKTTAKHPLNIWKPDLERPGAHYVYAHKYVLFFVDLLQETNDVEALGILARKMRKYSSGMIDHLAAWDHLCLVATNCLKQLIGVPYKYTEITMGSLVFEQFDNTAQKFLAFIEEAKEEEIPVMINALEYMADLRRMNNGFGSTAPLDDGYVCVYLKMHHEFSLKEYAKSTQSTQSDMGMKVDETHSEMLQASSNTVAQSPALAVPSSRISIQSLMYSPEPATPEAPASTPTPTASPGPSQGASQTTPQKVRVTKKDIISRASLLLKAALPKMAHRDKIVKDVYGGSRSGTSPTENPKDEDSKVASSQDGKQVDAEGQPESGVDAAVKDNVKVKSEPRQSEGGDPADSAPVVSSNERQEIPTAETKPSTEEEPADVIMEDVTLGSPSHVTQAENAAKAT